MWKDCGVAMTNHIGIRIRISFEHTCITMWWRNHFQIHRRLIGKKLCKTTRPDDRRRTPVIGPSTHPAAASHSASIRAG